MYLLHQFIGSFPPIYWAVSTNLLDRTLSIYWIVSTNLLDLLHQFIEIFSTNLLNLSPQIYWVVSTNLVGLFHQFIGLSPPIYLVVSTNLLGLLHQFIGSSSLSSYTYDFSLLFCISTGSFYIQSKKKKKSFLDKPIHRWKVVFTLKLFIPDVISGWRIANFDFFFLLLTGRHTFTGVFKFFYQIKYLPLNGCSWIMFLDQTQGLGGAIAQIAGSVGRSEAPLGAEGVPSQPAVYVKLQQKNKIK